MSSLLSADPLPLREDADGTIRVGSTRVLLDLVVSAFEDGATPEAIVERYSSLQLADVYAVIAHYLQHRIEVEEYLQRGAEQAARHRQMIEAKQPDRTTWRARLLARLSSVSNGHAPTSE